MQEIHQVDHHEDQDHLVQQRGVTIVPVCLVIFHTLYQLVTVVVAELRAVAWAVDQTLILTKLTTTV